MYHTATVHYQRPEYFTPTFSNSVLTPSPFDPPHLLGPPVAINANAALMFCCCFFFYSARDLRGLSADRQETLPHDRKWVQFYKVGPKIGGSPPKKWGRKTCFFRRDFGRLRIRSRISPERNKISTIGKRRCKLQSILRLLA